MHTRTILAIGIALATAAYPSWSQPPTEGKASTTPAASSANLNQRSQEEPKYLLFWRSPQEVPNLIERIGTKGHGKTRFLAHGLATYAFDYEDQLPDRIRSAFRVAREHDIGAMLHFGFHYFWKSRPDLWNWFDPDQPGYDPKNRLNVEWHGWDGPPNKVRYLDWGGLERLAPHMSFTSSEVRAEITRIVSEVIGPVLREEIERLEAAGKGHLFAGILVGDEPSIDDYSQPNSKRDAMLREDGVPRSPLGYRALLDRGFSEENPPEDFRQALAHIIQETVSFWCRQFVDAGLPPAKLYAHVAASAPIEQMNAPIWTAFNAYCRPGWTTYPVMVLGRGFTPLYDELALHGNPRWAGVEANPEIPRSIVDWETYLGWHYNHGAVLVGVLPRKELIDNAFGDDAIAAYRKFLAGEPLTEKPLSMDRPAFRVK